MIRSHVIRGTARRMDSTTHWPVARCCESQTRGPQMRRFGLIGGIFCFLLLTLVATAEVPQNVKAKGIRNMPYFEGTQLKAFFNAQTADPLPGGKFTTTGFKMLSYGPGGTNDLQFIIEAPNCIFDYEKRGAESSGPLQVYNSNTNYYIEGEGFFCRQTSSNAVLQISNRVHTSLQRETTNSTPAPPIKINSDKFHFISETVDSVERRIATYTENVRVIDPEFTLTADKLVVVIPPGTNKVRDVTATGHVVITSTADKSQAMGEEAVYSNDGTNEIVTLTGNPVWKDAQNQGSADTFIFDRRHHVVLAQHNARLRTPKKNLTAPALLNSSTNTAALTNQFIEITAEFLDIQLPETNSPAKSGDQQPRSLAARKNVVITSPADNMKATANSAFFDSASGLVFLRSNATWQTERMLAKAHYLTLDRSNAVFTARQNAYLRISETKPGATNRDLEIFSGNYELMTNIAHFRKDVRTELRTSDGISRLECNAMDAHVTSNEVNTIIAQQKVRLLQSATNSSRSLKGEEVVIKRQPGSGDIQSLLARTNVDLVQLNATTKETNRLRSDVVDMQFGKTNQLQHMEADGLVVELENGRNSARAEHVVYNLTSEGDRFELTGNPEAIFVRDQADGSVQKVQIKKATRMRIEPKTGKFVALGNYETVDLSSTNSTATITNTVTKPDPK